MADDKGITETAAFLFAKLGERVTAQFAERLAPLGLRPRHLAILATLARSAAPQMDLARALDVTPSVIVDMVDELENVGAVLRVRDTADRRRQVVELTPSGRTLLGRSATLARKLDVELLSALPAADRAPLMAALRRLRTAETRTRS